MYDFHLEVVSFKEGTILFSNMQGIINCMCKHLFLHQKFKIMLSSILCHS